MVVNVVTSICKTLRPKLPAAARARRLTDDEKRASAVASSSPASSLLMAVIVAIEGRAVRYGPFGSRTRKSSNETLTGALVTVVLSYTRSPTEPAVWSAAVESVPTYCQVVGSG